MNEAHRVGLHDAEGHLVALVQLMSAVHLALKTWLLPDRVLWAKLWGDHPQHWGARVREDKRLEYRPGRRQERDKKKIFIHPLHANVRKKFGRERDCAMHST